MIETSSLNQSASHPEPLLVGESFSPWTRKARWALEYCGVVHRYREYTPTLSEPRLRWRMRQWSGTVSVPVLFVGRSVLRGSWEIAWHANDASGDHRLGVMTDHALWEQLSEAALAEARTRVVRAVLSDDQALTEALPGFIPALLRKPLRPLARHAARRLDRKYAHLLEPGSIRRALSALRDGLKASGSDYLHGAFSHADISMAMVLEVIAPIAASQPPLGPHTQPLWADAALAEAFEDLVRWRDRLAADPATSYSQFSAMQRS